MKRVLALGLVTQGVIWLAHAGSEVTVLQPIRSFQVRGLDGFRLNDVAVYNGGFFLLLKDPSGSNEILRISGSGDILSKISLPSTQMFSQLRISPSGTLAVSLPHNGINPTTTIFLYDTEGGLKTSFDVPLFNEIAFIGDNLVGVGPGGITRLTSQSQFVPNGSSLPLDLLDRSIAKLLTASLPQDQLAIVEPVSGRLHIATMDWVLAAPMVLSAPEIQGVARLKSGDGIPLVVRTIAASPAGNLYIGVTGGRRQEGAPVLQFDRTGTLKNRIQCVLPTFGLDPSDYESYMYAAKLVATNDSLF